MIRLDVAAALGMEPGSEHARLSGIQLESDLPMEWLTAYRSHPVCSDTDAAPLEDFAQFSTRGDLAGKKRNVTVSGDSRHVSMEIEGIGRYEAERDLSEMVLIEAYPGTDRALVEQATLGFPLLLALATRGHWPMHASALAGASGIALVAGQSGAGKSTMAAHVAAQFTGMRRVADDVVHLRLNGIGVEALPSYPQLNLSHSEQRSHETGPVCRMFVLHKADEKQGLSIRPLAAGEKLTQLVRHSMAAVGWPPPLLKRHFEFCRRAAERMDMYSIRYPHNRAALNAVSKLVAGQPYSDKTSLNGPIISNKMIKRIGVPFIENG